MTAPHTRKRAKRYSPRQHDPYGNSRPSLGHDTECKSYHHGPSACACICHEPQRALEPRECLSCDRLTEDPQNEYCDGCTDTFVRLET